MQRPLSNGQRPSSSPKSGERNQNQRHSATLHLEWSPDGVRAVDVTDLTAGRYAEGSSVAELGSFLSGHRFVLVGMGRGTVFLKTVALPKAAPDDLRRILSVQIGQLFPLPATELAFDFLQAATRTNDGFLTVVAAVRTEHLERLHTELKAAGLQATRVLPVALGSAIVARRSEFENALVVESSGDKIGLDVIRDGVLRFSRFVPAGLERRGQLNPAPFGNDLVAEVQRTQIAAEVTGLPVVTVGAVPLPDAISAPRRPLDVLSEVTGFAFETTAERASRTKQRIAARTRFAVLLLLSALLLATLLFVERSEDMAVVTRASGRWAKELSKLRSIRDTETKKAQEATAMRTVLTSAFEPAQPLSDVVAVAGDALPKSVWLTGLAIERGKPLQLRGTATEPRDVARLVEDLGQNPRFRDVRLIFANSAKLDETAVVQFSITGTVVGNLAMPTPPKVKKTATSRSKTAGKTASTTPTATEGQP